VLEQSVPFMHTVLVGNFTQMVPFRATAIPFEANVALATSLT
jgi:hypothetical protein